MSERREPKTMGFQIAGSCMIFAHTAAAPSDAEWDASIALLSTAPPLRGVFVYTPGGGPNARQRKRIRNFWEGREVPPMAILTPSVVARASITALNLFLKNRLKAFAPDDFAGAFAYLALSSSESRLVRETATQLRRELGI
jgi:hypothetical protein